MAGIASDKRNMLTANEGEEKGRRGKGSSEERTDICVRLAPRETAIIQCWAVNE